MVPNDRSAWGGSNPLVAQGCIEGDRRFRNGAVMRNQMRSRIVHFILDPRVGGPHVYVDSLRGALDATYEMVVVTAGRGPMTDIALCNLRRFHRLLYSLELVVNALRLAYLIGSGQMPRRRLIFHVHGAANLVPIIVAPLFRIPVVWLFHETVASFRPLARLGLWLLKGTPHRVLVVTRKAAEVYGLNEFEIVPAAVDADFWKRDWGQRDATAERGSFRIVSVGNLNPHKGHDVLLRALHGLDGPWSLKIIGAYQDTHRPYYDLLQELAEKIRRRARDRRIEFVGWLDKEGVKRALAEADVFVLPSSSEACPIALLEAMAMECVCVASNVGGVAEMIGDNTGGMVVEAGDVGQLRGALIKTMGLRRPERHVMGQTARARIQLGGYDLTNMIESFRRIYSQCSGGMP